MAATLNGQRSCTDVSSYALGYALVPLPTANRGSKNAVKCHPWPRNVYKWHCRCRSRFWVNFQRSHVAAYYCECAPCVSVRLDAVNVVLYSVVTRSESNSSTLLMIVTITVLYISADHL